MLISVSQFQPKRRGVETRWLRLDANTPAATTVAMARPAPMIVVRTGTAVRPRPGSRAIRTPVLGTTGLPALRSHSETREGRLVASTVPWAARAYHHAD